MSRNLSISLVVYHPDLELLRKTVRSLNKAIRKAQQSAVLTDCHLTIVDNSDPAKRQNIRAVLDDSWTGASDLCLSVKNLGYGLGHNLAMASRCEDFHLVINPDVWVDEDAIIHAIGYLQANPQVGLVTPSSHQPNGSKEYLCKAYPSVFVLLVRGFAPRCIKSYFQTRISAYELCDMPETANNAIRIASGCFMFFRQPALSSVKGFSDKFFLYFEDFDLSLRLVQQWQIAYVPDVRIIHYGGKVAKKGLKHIAMFMRSAMTFFNRHGWVFF